MEDLKTRIARAICNSDDAGGDNWEEDQFWYMGQAAAVLPIVEAEAQRAAQDALDSLTERVKDAAARIAVEATA